MEQGAKSDAQLLHAWREGDLAAADQLVIRYFDSLYRFFRSKCEPSEVEDIVQRSFLACIEGKERIGEAGFRAYLFGVARRQLMDKLRKRYQHPDALNFDELSLADLGTTPSRQVARNQEHQRLLSAMMHLPIDTQILLELTYWEGMSAPEVSDVLEIPSNTIRGRLSRARSELRTHLADSLGSVAAVAQLLSTVSVDAD